jgi:hypothetical protein
MTYILGDAGAVEEMLLEYGESSDGGLGTSLMETADTPSLTALRALAKEFGCAGGPRLTAGGTGSVVWPFGLGESPACDDRD